MSTRRLEVNCVEPRDMWRREQAQPRILHAEKLMMVHHRGGRGIHRVIVCRLFLEVERCDARHVCVDLESITEVQVFKVGKIEESLLDADPLRLAIVISRGDLEEIILAILLPFLLRGSGSSSSITEFVATVQVPAEEQNEEDLAAVRSLQVGNELVRQIGFDKLEKKNARG